MQDEGKAGFWLAFNWKYHPGDDPQWALPEYDDRAWRTRSTIFPPRRVPEEWDGIGWFRLHLELDSLLWNRPLALSLWLWGAADVYLDGTRIASVGRVGASSEDEDAVVIDHHDAAPPTEIVFGAAARPRRSSLQCRALDHRGHHVARAQDGSA